MISLTQNQKSVLIGAILGDGYLQKTGAKNARLRLEHGKKQKDYLIWKVKILSSLFQGKAKYLERVHPISKKRYCYWRHQSHSTPYLGKIRKVFYPNNKKIIPKDLLNYLTPIMFAVWYMDDGYYYQRDCCGYLYLGNVSLKEAEIVSRALAKKFNLKPSALRKKRGYALYFSRKQMIKLKEIIKKHILPQFSYKLPS